MKIIFFDIKSLVILLLLFTSCGSEKNVIREVLKPPIVTLPSSINKVGILNRSIIFESKSVLDKLDKILSKERVYIDREGALEALYALKTTLTNTNKFTEVKIVKNTLNNNLAEPVFPNPLSWDIIESICLNNNIEALFVLSLFNINENATYGTFNTQEKGPLGIDIPAVHHKARVETIIELGWRIYDYTTTSISDELLVKEKITTIGKGKNPVEAIEATNKRKQVVLEVSQRMGKEYGGRLLPHTDNIYRKFYENDTKKFELASHYIETGDWQMAAKIWERETRNNNPEIAGKACFNMAFYNEINGDYDAAIEWANRAYIDYKNKEALRYIEDLNKHMIENNKLFKEKNSERLFSTKKH